MILLHLVDSPKLQKTDLVLFLVVVIVMFKEIVRHFGKSTSLVRGSLKPAPLKLTN